MEKNWCWWGFFFVACLLSCATLRPGPGRVPATSTVAKSPSEHGGLISSCLWHFKQLLAAKTHLELREGFFFWHDQPVAAQAVVEELLHKIKTDPYYPSIKHDDREFFWTYYALLPEEFDWLKDILSRADALELIEALQIAVPGSVSTSDYLSALRDWVRENRDAESRRLEIAQRQQWWQQLSGEDQQEWRTALNKMVNPKREGDIWTKYFYVPIAVQRVPSSEEGLSQAATVTIGGKTYHGKIKKGVLYLTVPTSLIKLRADNPLTHLKETLASTSGPRADYPAFVNLDGTMFLSDGNHTFHLYSRQQKEVVVRLGLPLRTCSLAQFSIYNGGAAPDESQITRLLTGELNVLDLLPVKFRSQMPWTVTDFVMPPSRLRPLF